MKKTNLIDPGIENEIKFLFTKSSGPGGQNINKVNTRVELRFDISNSGYLEPLEKEKLINKLKKKLSRDGFLILTSQKYRSQIKNKEDVLEKFYILIETSLRSPKKRIKGSPTPASVEERIRSKKIHSVTKKNRRSDTSGFES